MCLSIPGEVVTVRRDEGVRMGDVRFAGVVREVCLGCLDVVAVGEYVLVHVGFAISKVDEQEAQATRKLLEGMGAEYEQELEELRASVIE